MTQRHLFSEDLTIPERFDLWKATPGGAQVLCRAYRIAAGYGHRYQRTGQRVSMKLIYELLRDRVTGIRRELKRRGIVLKKENGFRLNNDFTAHISRHIISHRPEWAGMFELREIDGDANNLVDRREAA
jgi:hypothetical protein